MYVFVLFEKFGSKPKFCSDHHIAHDRAIFYLTVSFKFLLIGLLREYDFERLEYTFIQVKNLEKILHNWAVEYGCPVKENNIHICGWESCLINETSWRAFFLCIHLANLSLVFIAMFFTSTQIDQQNVMSVNDQHVNSVQIWFPFSITYGIQNNFPRTVSCYFYRVIANIVHFPVSVGRLWEIFRKDGKDRLHSAWKPGQWFNNISCLQTLVKRAENSLLK